MTTSVTQLTATTSLPPYPPNSVGEKAAFAAYAVLRASDLIPAGDWTIPHQIGEQAQAMWERTHFAFPQTIPVTVKPYNPADVWVYPVVAVGPLTCQKCGMRWEGAMGYCCPDNHCPVQPKATC